MYIRHSLFISFVLLLASVLPSHGAGDSLLKKATFCHGLDEKQAPKDTAQFFADNETIYLSIELKGRPKTGIVAAKFLFRDDVVAEGKVDVATVNDGVVFSIGENTFAGFNLTHKNPLPVGDCYRAEVSFDGKPLGTFPFRIAPPKDALPSKLKSATLAKGVDENNKPVDETHEFSGDDKVVLVCSADLGLSSWLEATWTVGGKLDDAGTRGLDIKENKKDVPFRFSFIPAGGWPAGSHQVVLYLDGKEVVREKFTVKAGAPAPAGGAKMEIGSFTFLKDDGKGGEGKKVKSFTTGDLVMHAQWVLKEEALAKGIQIVWKLLEAEGQEPQTIATVDLDAGMNDRLTSTLTTKTGLPVGKYQVELIKDGKLLDTKAFEVK